MKFIITESKLESLIFKYLDNQDFVKIEKDDYICFVNNADDEYAEIRYSKNTGWCYVFRGLINEISDFFSLSRKDSEKIISEWIENTLQVEVSNIVPVTSKDFLFV